MLLIGFILGEFYTDAYGNANEQSGSVLDNDNQNVGLVSVFVGPKECEMVWFFLLLCTACGMTKSVFCTKMPVF